MTDMFEKLPLGLPLQVIGIGVDITEVKRIEAAITRFGDRFLSRIYLPQEMQYCQSYKNPMPHLAARFAAKEAISKAFGTGIGKHLSWLDLEVGRKNSGEPFVILHRQAASLLEAAGAARVLISLSHTRQHAVAMAVLAGPSVSIRG